jgi:hypothetical protein
MGKNRIRDGKKVGSGIRDKHTGSATTYLSAGEGGAEDDEDDGQLGGSQSQPAPDLESEMEAGRIVPKPLPVSTPEPPGVRSSIDHVLFLTFFLAEPESGSGSLGRLYCMIWEQCCETETIFMVPVPFVNKFHQIYCKM